MALEGNFIRLEIDRHWFKDEEALAKRLALIVVGEQATPHATTRTGQAEVEWIGFKPYRKDANESWQLDSGNNWFFFMRDGKGYLHTRYWNVEDLSALDLALSKLLYGKREA